MFKTLASAAQTLDGTGASVTLTLGPIARMVSNRAFHYAVGRAATTADPLVPAGVVEREAGIMLGSTVQFCLADGETDGIISVATQIQGV